MREGIFQTSHDCAHPEISHAIPRASIIVMVRKPHDSNDQISKVKTVEWELHAKFVGASGACDPGEEAGRRYPKASV